MNIFGGRSALDKEKSKYNGSEAGRSVTCPIKGKNANMAEQSELGAERQELSLEKQAGSGHGEPWLY